MKIDPSLFNDKNVENSSSEHNVPVIVITAFVLLSLIFLGGGFYLLVSNPFTGVDIIEPSELSSTIVAVQAYQGPIWLIEMARKKIKAGIQEKGLIIGDGINIFKQNPDHLRPLKVDMEIGYLLGLGVKPSGEMENIVIKQLNPGKRLVVKIKGKGNFSGVKAYKAAKNLLQPKGLQPGAGERYEIKRKNNGDYQVEHWIPVR